MLFLKNGANPFISDRQDQKERIKRQSLNRSRVDANIIHKFVLEHKLLKGYFVYD